MTTTAQARANEAIGNALKELRYARELSARANHSQRAIDALLDAERETQYALDTALGTIFQKAGTGKNGK